MAPMRRGVIAPGLGTTATHSVHYVLCALGFNSIHTHQNYHNWPLAFHP